MDKFTEENSFAILEAYFRENSLVDNQIKSFDDFLEFGIPTIVSQEPTISIPNYSVKFDKVEVANPKVIEQDRSLVDLYPSNARTDKLSYDSAIHCDLIETYTDNDNKEKTKTHSRITIGRIPVMVRSAKCNLSSKSKDECIQYGECPNDKGGYFIIKGNEHVLVGQLRAVYNHVFVLKQKLGEKYKYIADTRSMSNETGHSVLIQAVLTHDDHILFHLPYVKEPIPAGIVFKAFGIGNSDDRKETEEEYMERQERNIIRILGLFDNRLNKFVRFILNDSYICQTQDDALLYIGNRAISIIQENKRRNYAKQVLETEILPHMGISSSPIEQACFLGGMVRLLLMTSIGMRAEDDRDNYANKRVEVAGHLLYDLFRNIFTKFRQYIKTQLEKRKQRPDIISIITRTRSITKGLHQCISTGKWGIQKSATYMRTGVSQILDRMTYCATLSHLRRVLIPVGKEGKNSAMRQIHPSSFGVICPCECFHPDTPILLWNGKVKKASDICAGETLIDDKGNPTKVKSVCFGIKEMIKIAHDNPRFSDYIVTDNHILTLKSLKTGNVIDMSITEYQKCSPVERNDLVAFKSTGINWPVKPIHDSPYDIGLKAVRIPQNYLVNSKNNRLQLLKGLTERFGTELEETIIFQTDNTWLLNDVLFLVRSLGMKALLVKNQLTVSTDQDTSSFDLIPQSVQPFVGWQLEGNGRFLLGDFTATHNTPEGQRVGIVLNLAILAKITRKIPTVIVRRVVDKCKTIQLASKMIDKDSGLLTDLSDYFPVFLNGVVVGYSDEPDETVQEIKAFRHRNLLPKEVSVVYDSTDRVIRIYSDEGRFSRPLLTLTDNKLNIKPAKKYNWEKMIREGVVQYVDCSETENSVIAMRPEMTKVQYNDYCEIHPSTMLGIMASLIPFSDHSQSPRNCYQCLWEEEEILMADRTLKKIKDIKIGDEIITINPKTYKQSITRVINQFVRKTEKKMVKISTISGRELVCTVDHPILTRKGWKKAGELDINNDTVAVNETVNLRDEIRMEKIGDTIFVPVARIKEHQNVMIADITTESETHSFITGQGFCVHNSSMGKQALGIPLLSYKLRTDTLLHILQYAQKPLVATKYARMTDVAEMPSGINAVVAIQAYSGFNFRPCLVKKTKQVRTTHFMVSGQRIQIAGKS